MSETLAEKYRSNQADPEFLFVIDDIGVEFIAMHYGIGWGGGKTKGIPTRLMGNLLGILFVFSLIQYQCIMVLDGGKDKEYSHKIDGKSFGNTLCLSPHPIP